MNSVKIFRLPIWLLAIALVPLGMIFFASLAMAVVIAALGLGAYLFVAPLFRSGRRPETPLRGHSADEPRGNGEIVLDRSEYKRIEPRSTDRSR